MPLPSRARRSSPVVAVLIGLALALTLLPGATAASARPTSLRTAAAPPSAALGVFTLNVQFALTAEQALADMTTALTLGDVGGFQEMSDAEDRLSLMALLQSKGWGWYMPVSGGNAIPVVWNKARFRLVSGETVMTHPALDGMSPARYINTVYLREVATGKLFAFINTHAISEASFDAQASDPQRIPYLRQHLAMLRQAIALAYTRTEYVFAGGDLNVNYLADRRRQVPGLPTSALGDLVDFDMPLEGTWGPTSLLDYGMTVKNSGYRLRESRVVRGFNSDHDALAFIYDPVDLFAEGPLFNRPIGTPAEKRNVQDRLARAVMDAEAGATVQVAMTALDDPQLIDALVAARAEGVNVQVVMGPGAWTDQLRTLIAALGTDQTQPSWFRQCVRSCLGGPGGQQTNFILVSRAGGATNLSMVAAGATGTASTGYWNDALLSTTYEVYRALSTEFSLLAQDGVDPRPIRSRKMGPYAALYYPTPETTDHVLKVLKGIKCAPSGNRRTRVWVSVPGWAGARGRVLADKLVTLKGYGCDVRAVLGRSVKSSIKRRLTKGKIPTVDRSVAGPLMIVDGRYRKSANARIAWVGGPDWTKKGQGSDAVTVVFPDQYVGDYLKQWKQIWAGPTG